MNHLNPDESSDWDDDIDAFEQQLRAIRPAPPAREFSEIAESLEAAPEQVIVTASVPAANSIWRPIVSHAVTAAIGLAVGIGVMRMQQPNASVSTNSSGNQIVSVPTELVENQNLEKKPEDATTPETIKITNLAQTNFRRSEPAWSTQRLPLRAFGSLDGRLASVNDWQPLNKPEPFLQREDEDDASDIEYDDLPADKPSLSPRSFHLFLDDLTYTPTSNNPFCSSEDFSS